MATITGKINNLTKEFKSGKFLLTFEVPDTDEVRALYDQYNVSEQLDISVDFHYNTRTYEQNALFWACVHELAMAMPGASNEQVYHLLLKRYGKYEYVEMKKVAWESFKEKWRDTEILREYKNDEGEDIVEALCYYGTSSLNTKEFSHLIDGTLSEMRELELDDRIPKKK